MRRPLRLASAALALLLAGCSPMFYVELVIPEVRVTLPQQSFPGSAGADPSDWCTPSDPDCLFKELDYDFAGSVPLVGEDHVSVDLRLTGLAMVLDSGAADLGSVESVTLKLLDPDDPARSVVAASYVRNPADPNPTTITVSGNANIDLGSFLDGSSLIVRAELVSDGDMPAFVADVSADFSLVLTMDYGAYVF